MVFMNFCSSRDRNDMDVIRENHKFVWDDEDDDSEDNWYENCICLPFTRGRMLFLFLLLLLLLVCGLYK
jgi:hypothetical protein